MIQSNYSYGIERDKVQLELNDGDHTKWSNPLEVRYAALCLLEPCAENGQTPACTFNENLLCLWSRKRNGGASFPNSLARSNFTFTLLAIILVTCILFNSDESHCILRYARGGYESDETLPNAVDVECAEPDSEGCTKSRPALNIPLSRTSFIDAAYTNETSWPQVRVSVRLDHW